jgi:4-diphosphocytidyl-2-C-methyl-D-erythritol kinase
VILKSPAKVNLYLEVLNKRKDGFHNINTVFEKIALCDVISLKRRKKGIKIISSGEKIPLGRKNLAYKAASLLQRETGLKKGVEIRIKKNIPVGAGLGGGSSNAACVLLGLNRLWHLRLSNKKLLKLGAQIGSDVPFFLSKATWAIGRGRGEILKPISSSWCLWHLIVVPHERISTKNSYHKLSLNLTKKQLFYKIVIYAIRRKKLNLLKEALFNRLEDSQATANCFSIKKIKTFFADLGLKALMSGSGSAVFAVFPERKEALEVQKALLAYPWKVFLVRTWAKTT